MMFMCEVIVILIAFYTFSDAYTVQKVGFNPKNEAISFLRQNFVEFVAKHNITDGDELKQGWENVSHILEASIAKAERNSPNFGKVNKDPDASRNSTELIRSKGLDAEEHRVTTADGYILLIIHIVSPKLNKKSLPVFMQHGLLDSSDCFILNLRNESLAFLLADAGYDVWLGNIRGNRYTTKHQSLQPTDKKFWKWSFDEMGLYDIPVMIDYVLSKTGHQKLNYVGHSEGTTNLISSVVALGSPMSSKINKFIALAPAVYVSHSKGLLRQLGRFARTIQKLWDPFGHGDVFAHDGYIARIVSKYCSFGPPVCAALLHSIVGPGNNHFNISRITVYLSHAPAGTSTQNLVHWSQLISDGNTFKYYDYGCAWKNYIHYKQFHPPVYDLKKFTVPTYAFFGNNDWLVTPPDAKSLTRDLPNIKSLKTFDDYNHMDFVWGYNVAHTLYKDVLNILASDVV